MKDYYVYVYWFGIDGGPGGAEKYPSFYQAWEAAQHLMSDRMGYGRGNNEVVIRGVVRNPSVEVRSLVN